MGPETELPLQVLGVVEHAHDLEAPVVQAEERPDGHVVDARFHGAVQGVEPPIVIGLDAAGGVDRTVGRVIVGFLEDLEGADAGALELAEVRDGHRRGVDVHPADLAPADARLDLDAVDPAHALGDVVRVGLRMLAVHGHQTLVAERARKDPRLLFDLLEAEGAPLDGPIARAEAAVDAVVHAPAAAVQRREGDHPVVVDLGLDRRRRVEDFLPEALVAHVQQRRGVPRIERLDVGGLGENLAYPRRLRLGVARELSLDESVVDEVFAVYQILVDLVLADDPVLPRLTIRTRIEH